MFGKRGAALHPVAAIHATDAEFLVHHGMMDVAVTRPLCGIDNYAADTLRSAFELDYPRYEILFASLPQRIPCCRWLET
jgi:hypothetical protein